MVDPESDVEEEMEPGPPESNKDPYFVDWDNFFIDGISIDQRGQLDKASAALLGFRNVLPPTDIPKITLFHLLLPKVYILDHLMPATNTELKDRE